MNVYARVKNFDKIRKMDATLIDFFFVVRCVKFFFPFATMFLSSKCAPDPF